MFLENLGASNTTNTDFLQQRRKIPRCVLGFDPLTQNQALRGVKAIWDDRTETEIYDINLSGLVMARRGALAQALSRAKRGQVLKVHLEFDGVHELEFARQNLAVRILDLGTDAVFGMFDSISAGGRLHLPQEAKDAMAIHNWVRRNPSKLEIQYRNSYWFHGPFDTNLMVNSDSSGLLEYDGLLLKWNRQGPLIFKASSSSAEGENYSSLWTSPPGTKVIAGNSWMERWSKLLEGFILKSEAENTLDAQSLMILKKSHEFVSPEHVKAP